VDWHVKCYAIHEPVAWSPVSVFDIAFDAANFDKQASVDR
jgi:hypothetical protein